MPCFERDMPILHLALSCMWKLWTWEDNACMTASCECLLIYQDFIKPRVPNPFHAAVVLVLHQFGV